MWAQQEPENSRRAKQARASCGALPRSPLHKRRHRLLLLLVGLLRQLRRAGGSAACTPEAQSVWSSAKAAGTPGADNRASLCCCGPPARPAHPPPAPAAWRQRSSGHRIWVKVACPGRGGAPARLHEGPGAPGEGALGRAAAPTMLDKATRWRCSVLCRVPGLPGDGVRVHGRAGSCCKPCLQKTPTVSLRTIHGWRRSTCVCCWHHIRIRPGQARQAAAQDPSSAVWHCEGICFGFDRARQEAAHGRRLDALRPLASLIAPPAPRSTGRHVRQDAKSAR